MACEAGGHEPGQGDRDIQEHQGYTIVHILTSDEHLMGGVEIRGEADALPVAQVRPQDLGTLHLETRTLRLQEGIHAH